MNDWTAGWTVRQLDSWAVATIRDWVKDESIDQMADSWQLWALTVRLYGCWAAVSSVGLKSPGIVQRNVEYFI